MSDQPLPPGVPSGLPEERLRAWLQVAAERAPLPVPARSPEDVVARARRAEQQAGGADVLPLEPGELELLADLACAEHAVAEGTARAPSQSVMAAVVEAYSGGAGGVPTGQAGRPAPVRESVPGPGVVQGASGAPEAMSESRRDRVLRAQPAVGGRRARVLVLFALCAIGLAWVVAGRVAPASLPPVDEVADAELERAFAASLASAAEPLAGQVSPFVDARLWRSLEGRAWRGGEALSIAPAARSVTAQPVDAAGAGGDVVLAWRPDASMADAAGLRVHLRGPAGLRVALPDLGVEAVLDAAVDGAGAGHVDLPLPGGWAEALAGGDLRLAFTWPSPVADPVAGEGAAAPAVPAASPREARFAGVSLSTWRVAEGG